MRAAKTDDWESMKRQAVCVVGALWLALGSATATPSVDPTNESGASLGPATEQQPAESKKVAPEVELLKRRLAEKDMILGSPIMIRIFKSESELEVWVQKGDRYDLLNTYAICTWSGKLGPKVAEGDRQSPEGFYAVDTEQLHLSGRHPRSLDIGYPNTLDRSHGRTGSFILVHGGCTSIGCFAMTDPLMEEIFTLANSALKQGQEQIQVHVFPFRMTDANMQRHAQSQWAGFWQNLKPAYDMFEASRVPPTVSVCGGRYEFGEGEGSEHCTENISQRSVLSVAAINARRVAQMRKVQRVRQARAASRIKHAKRTQRNRGHASISRAGRMALGGPKVRRR